MNAPQLPDDEVLWFLEAEGALPMRPIRERWPELFAVPASILPTEYPEILLGDDGPIIPVPAHWYPGVPLPATYEPEEIPGYVEPANEPAAGMVPDWLEQGCSKYGVIPPGPYAVEIMPRDIRLISTPGTRGISFVVGIVGGKHAGIECRLNFLCDGPDAIVRRDLGILKRWGEAVGVGRTRDIGDLVEQLGRAGEGRRVTLGIISRETRSGIELTCTSVEVEGQRDD